MSEAPDKFTTYEDGNVWGLPVRGDKANLTAEGEITTLRLCIWDYSNLQIDKHRANYL